MPGKLAQVADILRSIRQITECERVTGEDCFLAWARVSSVQAMEVVIDRIIPYAMTNTSIIRSSPVAPRLPPLEKATRDR